MEAAGFAEPSRSHTAPGSKARPTKRRNSASPMRKSSINALLGRHSRSSKKLGRESAASRVSTSLGIGSPDSPLVGRMSNVFGGAGGEDLTQLWAKQAALTRTLEARVCLLYTSPSPRDS